MTLPLTTLQVLHVSSVLLLVGMTFAAFAAPLPEKRKFSMIKTGILSVVVVVSGFGLAAKYEYGFPTWIMIKLGCWVGIAGISGLAFRSPKLAGILSLVTAALVVVAVYTVYILKNAV